MLHGFEVSPLSSTSSLPGVDGDGDGDAAISPSPSFSPAAARSESQSRASYNATSPSPSPSPSTHVGARSSATRTPTGATVGASSSSSSLNRTTSASVNEPFDFHNSTLNLLHQQQQYESQWRQSPQQKQFVQNIIQPLRFSDAPSPAPHATAGSAAAAPLSAVPPNDIPPPPAGSTDPHHSAFLIQDRIHFFERYAVQPHARGGGGGGAQLSGSATQPVSVAPSSTHVNAPIFTTTTVPYTKHAGVGSSAVPSLQGRSLYGSHLGQPSGSYTDRHADTYHSTVGDRRKPVQSRALAGSGAPPSIRKHTLAAAHSKHGAPATSVPMGFGSGRVKDTTATIAPNVANKMRATRTIDTNANKSSSKGVSVIDDDPSMRVYDGNLFHPPGIGGSFGSRASRFDSKANRSVASSSSHSQWGGATSSHLPPYLDVNTAKLSGVVARKSPANGIDADHDSNDASPSSILPNGLGGYILDHSSLNGLARPTTIVQNMNLDSTNNASTRGGGGGGGTISMRDHCRIVNDALARKTAELLAIYRDKISNEATHLASDFYFHGSNERAEVSKVLQAYQVKLEDISTQFTSLHDVQQKIHELKLSNGSLRIFNLELARTYDSELQDMKLEIELLQQQNETPLQQIHSLEKHVLLKEQERKALESEIADLTEQLSQQKPFLTSELNRISSRATELHDEIAKIHDRQQSDLQSQKDEITNLQSSIGQKLQQNMALTNSVESLKKQVASQKGKLGMTKMKLEQEKHAYETEVNKGMKELENLQQELNDKSHAFNDHYLLIQTAIEICSNIDSKLKIDLLCRNCMQLMVDPMLLWPCGHTLCSGCVTRVGLDGTPMPPAATNRQPNAAGGVVDVNQGCILICTECKYNFDHPLTHDTVDDDYDDIIGEGNEDLAFPNPFFDPPPNFNGRFYMTPNKIITKLVEAYKYEEKQNKGQNNM